MPETPNLMLKKPLYFLILVKLMLCNQINQEKRLHSQRGVTWHYQFKIIKQQLQFLQKKMVTIIWNNSYSFQKQKCHVSFLITKK